MEEQQLERKRSSSVEAAVAEALRTAILHRRLLPGQKIIQEEVARELGVSRVPVREALRRLQAEGWVNFDHGRGFVVAVATIEDVYEMYVIRMALEGVAAREGTKSASEEAVARARGILERMRQVGTAQEWLELNEEFHLTIYRQSRMDRVIDLIKRYTMATSRWVYSFIGHPVNRGRADEQHEEILRAVGEGRCEDAERLTILHLAETRDNAIAWLKTVGEIQPRERREGIL